jgi:hypothetical protein
MKISKNELKKMESEGAVVKRKMGKGKSPEPVETPKPVETPPAKEPAPHASMSASMDHVAAQVKATLMTVAQNGELLRQFKESLEALVEPREPSEYTFDVVRDGEGLLKRVLARPGIEEEA